MLLHNKITTTKSFKKTN